MLSRRTLLSLPAAYWLARNSPLFAAPLPNSQTWPAIEWSQTTPEQAGWDPAFMSEARRYSHSIDTASFMAIQHGVVVDSWGDIDRRIELRSMRKSLLSALIGIAVSEHKISLEDTLSTLGIDDVPPSLTPQEKEATVRDLLKGRSGVYHAAAYEDPEEKKLRPPRVSHAPGTFWYYNNWDFNALGAIYEKAVGTSIFEAFKKKIADPIGMQDYRPSDGRYEREDTSRFPAYPFHMTARDLARFGLLFLRGGRWGDQQVVPASWVDESTKAWSGPTDFHSGYGYMWWAGYPDKWIHVIDLPPGGFWADGWHGQFIIVDPRDDLVVVHQTDVGKKVGHAEMGHLIWLVLNAARATNPGADPTAGKE